MSGRSLDPSLDGRAVRVTESETRRSIDVGLHDGPERQRLARELLPKIGAGLEDALAAADRDDWAAVLGAGRLIQGRATIVCAVLERLFGSDPTAGGPPLERAVRAVGRLISEGEVDSLPPDELHARMHAVLQALDHELRVFLHLPDEAPGREGRRQAARVPERLLDLASPRAADKDGLPPLLERTDRDPRASVRIPPSKGARAGANERVLLPGAGHGLPPVDQFRGRARRG